MAKFRYKNGAERVISDRDARILTLLKKGSVVVDLPHSVEAVEDFESKPKKSYRRKDMKAA